MASQEQMARALRVAKALGVRPPCPHGLYKAMLELVEADEKPGPPLEVPAKPPPVSDARKVLAPVRKHPKKAVVDQEGLW